MEEVGPKPTTLDVLNRNLKTISIISAKLLYKVENNVELTRDDRDALELTTKSAAIIAKNEREERKELDALSVEEMEAKLKEMEENE